MPAVHLTPPTGQVVEAVLEVANRRQASLFFLKINELACLGAVTLRAGVLYQECGWRRACPATKKGRTGQRKSSRESMREMALPCIASGDCRTVHPAVRFSFANPHPGRRPAETACAVACRWLATLPWNVLWQAWALPPRMATSRLPRFASLPWKDSWLGNRVPVHRPGERGGGCSGEQGENAMRAV